MKADPGTYALIFEFRQTATVEVGRLGPVALQPGYYIYVGSALGPGGVKARVERHWRTEKRAHWHIDFVADQLIPIEAWYVHGPSRDEHRWAAHFSSQSEVSAVQGFGASDCRCGSHFFRLNDLPDRSTFARFLGERVQVASPAGAS